jgi:hypothetical protein
MRAVWLLAILCALGGATLGGLYLSGGMLADDAPDPALAHAQTLDWVDLIPVEAAAARLNDGTLPRGIVQHGEMGRGDPPDLAARLGGFGNLDAPPRRMSDAFGGLGNLRALQPRGGDPRRDLDGQLVRLAGFVTPLAFEGSRIAQFLLVPYVGACIHVPPPPANQIVLVTNPGGYRPDGSLLYPVWVTGTLRAGAQSTDLADAGYQIDGAHVERYQEPAAN